MIRGIVACKTTGKLESNRSIKFVGAEISSLHGLQGINSVIGKH